MQKGQTNYKNNGEVIYKCITYIGKDNPLKIVIPLISQKKNAKCIGISSYYLTQKSISLQVPLQVQVKVKQVTGLHNVKGSQHDLIATLPVSVSQKPILQWGFVDSDPDWVPLDPQAQGIELSLHDEKGNLIDLDTNDKVFSIKMILKVSFM